MSVSLGKDLRKARTANEPIRIPAGAQRVSGGAAQHNLTPSSPLHSEVVVTLAPALDAIGGNRPGHVLRSTYLGMRLGVLLDLGQLAASDLFYALLLKDIGAAGARAQCYHLYGELDKRSARLLQNADLTDLSQSLPLAAAVLRSGAPLGRRLRNVTDLLVGNRRQPGAVVRTASRMAANLALDMGFSHGTAAALRSQTERWDGRGRPDGLAGEAIPVASRVLAVTDELELLLTETPPDQALEHLERDAGRRFDPVIVRLAAQLVEEPGFLERLNHPDLERLVLDLEPMQRRHVALASRVDKLLSGIGRLIDSRSSWRARHSERVRQLAVGAAAHLPPQYRLSISGRRRLARAALLHDVGKIGTPVALHDRPQALTGEELRGLQGDDVLVKTVLERVLDLADSALVTETFVIAEGSMNGSDAGDDAPESVRSDLMTALVAVADRFEALLAPRPQRAGRSSAEALETLWQEVDQRTAAAESTQYPAFQPWSMALTALERFVATPAASALLTPQKFDADAIVVVE